MLLNLLLIISFFNTENNKILYFIFCTISNAFFLQKFKEDEKEKVCAF